MLALKRPHKHKSMRTGSGLMKQESGGHEEGWLSLTSLDPESSFLAAGILIAARHSPPSPTMGVYVLSQALPGSVEERVPIRQNICSYQSPIPTPEPAINYGVCQYNLVFHTGSYFITELESQNKAAIPRAFGLNRRKLCFCGRGAAKGPEVFFRPVVFRLALGMSVGDVEAIYRLVQYNKHPEPPNNKSIPKT